MTAGGPVAAVLAAMFLSSCGNGLLAELSRTTGDPTVTDPAVSSFVTENQVVASWPLDVNADTYMLERAADAAPPIFQTVYAGTGTSYTDTNCTNEGRYLYRLTKTRGTRSFGPSEAVMGVAGTTSRDALEPNDTEDQGTPLIYERDANLYYYSSVAQQNGAPLVVQDADWYSVTVPAKMQANIKISQDKLSGGSLYTWMYFYQKGFNPVQIIDSQPIAVSNYGTSDATYLFEIYPVPSSPGFPTNGGGSLISYKVFFLGTTNL